jgi:hypothetical protein
MHQHIVEDAQDHLDELEDEAERATEEMRKQFGPDAARVLVNYEEWSRYSDLQMRILRAVAEEMGQIPARAPAPGATPLGVDLSRALGLLDQPVQDAGVIDVEPISDPLPAISQPVQDVKDPAEHTPPLL